MESLRKATKQFPFIEHPKPAPEPFLFQPPSRFPGESEEASQEKSKSFLFRSTEMLARQARLWGTLKKLVWSQRLLWDTAR